MIQVKRATDGTYTVKVDRPEEILLLKIGKAYALPLRDVMGSVILRGMDSICKIIETVDHQDGSTNDHSQDDVWGP